MATVTEELALFVTRDNAANVLNHAEGLGYAGGSFTSALIHAIFKADTSNRFLLSQGFPGEVAAVKLYTDHENGREVLLSILNG